VLDQVRNQAAPRPPAHGREVKAAKIAVAASDREVRALASHSGRAEEAQGGQRTTVDVLNSQRTDFGEGTVDRRAARCVIASTPCSADR